MPLPLPGRRCGLFPPGMLAHGARYQLNLVTEDGRHLQRRDPYARQVGPAGRVAMWTSSCRRAVYACMHARVWTCMYLSAAAVPRAHVPDMR